MPSSAFKAEVAADSWRDRLKTVWPWARRALTAVFFIGLIALLTQRIGAIDWTQVSASLARYRPATLVTAAALAALSYALYGSFDLLGRRYTGHTLPTRNVVGTAFVSYALNLNLGALVGGIGLRYRLYSRAGLAGGTITRVVALSMMSNWLGYGLLLGAVILAGAIAMPEAITRHAWAGQAIQLLGFLMLLPAPAYLAWCAWSRQRIRMLRGLSIKLPHFGMALLQLGLSLLNWMTIGAILWVLVSAQGASIDYPVILAALLLAAVAGVLTHVPAGLGVLEAVFLTLLVGQVDEAPLLAALLAYRALYYLIPGAAALLIYLGMEARARRRPVAV